MVSVAGLIGMLDVSSAEGTFHADIGVSVTALGGTEGPLGNLTGATSLAVTADTTALTSTLGAVAEAALGVEVPDLGALVGPIRTGIESLGGAGGEVDFATSVEELIRRISDQLGGSRDSGFLGIVEGLGTTLGSGPEAAALRAALRAVLELGGGGLDVGATLGEAVPALVGTLRGLGAAMSLETVLAEAERLGGIMAAQLDADAMRAELAMVSGAFESGSFSIASLREAGAGADAALIADATAAVRALRVRLGAVVDQLSRGMGFGEATLVHLDFARLTADVARYSGTLQGLDVDVVGRAVRALTDPIRPFLSVDFGDAPAAGLEGVLTLLEGRTADIAAAITGAEVDRLAEPLAAGIGQVTGALREVSAVIESVVSAVRGALEQVRQAVAALPFDDIAAAVRAFLDPVREAMAFATDLVGDVQEALDAVAGAVTGTLEEAEAAIDAFKAQVDQALDAAADFIEGLNLDGVVGEVAGGVAAFTDVLAQAQMKPYFDTAVGGIDAAADVIGAVPLGLLPSDMKAELDAAVAPLRAIDVPATIEEIEGWFQIDAEGRFTLRAPLEEALAEIREQYDAFIAQVEQADPRALVAPIDASLAELKAQVEAISPQLSLEPVEQAIQRVKAALGSFDLRRELAPVDEAFQQIVAKIRAFSPTDVVGELERGLDGARAKLLEVVRLDEWLEMLDQLETHAADLIARADPTRIEPLLERGSAEAERLLDRLGDPGLSAAFGDFVAALLAESDLPAGGWSVRSVASWLGGEEGSAQLQLRATALADSVRATRTAVAAVDVDGARQALSGRLGELRTVANGLAPSPERSALLVALDSVDPVRTLAPLVANRARYLTALDEAVRGSETLSRTGLTHVDVSLRGLRVAFQPAASFRDLFRATLRNLGIQGLEEDLAQAIRGALAVATPARVAGIFVPIFTAIRDRIMALVGALLAPLREGIGALRGLIDAIDLTPLREGLEAVVDELVDEILSLSPTRLLDPSLQAVEALQAELAAFDPLAPVRAVLDALKAVTVRLLGKLDAEELLEDPIRIYDEIMKALRALAVDELMGPVLDQLDALAKQVDTGLDDTGAALVRLQDALPEPGGGLSVSVSASISL